MPKSAATVFGLLCVLLTFSIGKAEEHKNNEVMYYWEKGNEGGQLTIGEFNFLIKQLEDKMLAFREAFSIIYIADTDVSYKTGVLLEIELTSTKEYLETAFKYLSKVKVSPNSMFFSLGLYVILKDVLETANSFSHISQFDKCLNNTYFDLSLWCRAFQKAHLNFHYSQ